MSGFIRANPVLTQPLSKGLMIFIGSLALAGILFKLTIAHRFKVLSMMVKLAPVSVTLLEIGGIVYSLWVIFYVYKRTAYNHAI